MDEDTTARLRWYRLILETLAVRGFAQAMPMLSEPDLKASLNAAIEVEAWRAVMPQYEFRCGAIHRKPEHLPPASFVKN